MTSRLAKVRRVLWMAVWATCALVGGYALFRISETPASSGYENAFGGRFTLTDRNGLPFSDSKLKGKPFAIFFGYTRCPDVCPTSLNLMARLRKELGADGNKFEIVFVSVDPDHDSPKTVGNYVDLFGTPIIGLTGSDQQITEVAKAYHLYVAKVPQPGGDFSVDHTAAIFLMGRNGEFISTIDNHEDPKMALAKLKRLVAS